MMTCLIYYMSLGFRPLAPQPCVSDQLHPPFWGWGQKRLVTQIYTAKTRSIRYIEGSMFGFGFVELFGTIRYPT